MKIIAVDDEIIALKSLELKLRQINGNVELTTFSSPVKALDWAGKNSFDLAFLDINMRGIDGLSLASNLKVINPKCMIVFVTGYAEYAVQAFKLKANGYLVKPIETEDLKTELEYAEKHIENQAHSISDSKLYIQCFGSFEVFSNGKPISFRRKKSKEVLAYLIDRKGASVTVSDIAAILWDDGVHDISRTNQIHTFLHDLVKALDNVGQKNVIIKTRNSISVDTGKVDCDFYDCIKGDPAAINRYTGEYMTQYSWAEITGGKLAGQLI